jgi:ABC-type multidrug transport system fused ATPase/permease subunit
VRSIIRLYREVLSVLPASARRFLLIYMIALAALSLLDGAALGLLAAATAPILTGSDLVLPIIGTVSEIGLVIMLGLVCALIVLKSVLAVLMMWGATRRFANYEYEIGRRLFESYIHAPWTERLKRNSAELVRLTDTTVATTISNFLLPGASLLGEFSTFVVILAVLAIAQPIMAAVAFAYLMVIGAVLFFWVTGRSRAAGRANQAHSVRNVRLLTEMVAALKEVTLRNKLEEVGSVVQANRRFMTRARANIQFLGQVPRYVLESAIIGGVVVVGITGAITDGGVAGMLTAVAIFGLAGFRLAPSLVRFQNVVSLVSSSQPGAAAVIEEIRAVEKASLHLVDRPSRPLAEHPKELRFESVSFRYADDAPDAVRDLELQIAMGSRVAFVGSSGAGKSTIVDLVLGLIEPTTGRVSIDGEDLRELSRSWRDRVGYVPQDVTLFDASVAQNVALTWTENYDRDLVRRPGRRARPHPVRRPAPASRHRPRALHPPARARDGRGDERPRHRDGSRCREGDPRPPRQDHPDLGGAPARDDPRRRPHLLHVRRQDRGIRHVRRAGRGGAGIRGAGGPRRPHRSAAGLTAERGHSRSTFAPVSRLRVSRTGVDAPASRPMSRSSWSVIRMRASALSTRSASSDALATPAGQR